MSIVNSEHWQRVKDVFEGALELNDVARAEFLERACAGDALLGREVESLLRSFGEAGSFLEAPAVAGVAASLVGPQAKLAAGQQVGHYEILAPIAEGGMGEVYRAKDTILGRQVALKVLPEYVGKDPDRLRRFQQEARSASTLNHPGVCVIHQIGETDDGRPFIAMECIDGVTLRQRLNDRHLKLGAALDIAIQIADALRAAHEARIVHRDIKPENIMIRRDGYVKVFDFGLAKLTEHRGQVDQTTMSALLVKSSPGTVMGTAAYMSPEQARGVQVDERTDIWSLGVVLYEIISGHAPFTGETATDVVVAIVEKEPPAISQFVTGVPAELERIVRKALRKGTDERYQIIQEMAIDLRSLRKDLEMDSQLDRSLAPTLPGPARTSQELQAPTGPDRQIDTDQLQASRLTAAPLGPGRSLGLPARVAITTLMLVIAIGGLATYRFTRRDERPRLRFQQTNVTKLTTNGNALFASISPDGKYVAYAKSEGGKESLWLRQVGSAGNLEIVPPREGHYQGVTFSPDGNFIYYGYAPTANSECEIFRVPVLGSGAPAVKVNPNEGPHTLSHDGQRVAFLRHSPNRSDLVIAKADGSGEETVATRQWPEKFSWNWATAPAWTNDDQNLALPVVRSDASGFYVTITEKHLADRSERTINLSSQRFEQPDNVNILSDGSAVILSARAQGASFTQIWQLGRDGSARALTNDLSDYSTVFLTADSRALVTTQRQNLANIWVAHKGDPTHAAQVTSGLGRYFDLCWAPDGKIVYASDASGSADIYEISVDGTNVRQLTSGMKRNYAPAVSPDNRFIVLHSNRSGIFQIWRMERDGSNPVQLTTGNSESNWPQFSADGKFVIYQHFEPGSLATIWRVPIEGGAPTRLVEGFAVRPAVSADGKWLGFWQNDGQQNAPWRLALLSLESGVIRTFNVAPTVTINWDTPLRWSADSRSLTYVDHRGGVDNLWAQPIDGSPLKQVTSFADNSIFSFDWSRTGSLATSRGMITSDVVLITDAGQ